MRDLAVLKSMRVERPSPYGWPTFLDDLKAGLVSLLVNIPLAMGIGVVSGMGVPAALYSAVIVGIVSALLGGTRAMKSGPSISLAVIVGTILSSGEADILQIGIVVAMAGAMQIAFGLFGLGRLMAYLPHVVLAGFMSGIGCFLIWSQTWRLIGFGRADMAVAGTCVAIILLWPRVLRKHVPGPFVGIAAAWAVSALWLPGSTLLGALPTGLPDMAISTPSLEFLATAIGPALLIAAIGSAHTLMVALAADSITGGRHNPNRELAATGVANLATGVFGGVPGSGNFSTIGVLLLGGRTVVAGIAVAVGIAGFMLGLGPFVETLPVAAVLAVVLWMGWGLVDWRLLTRVHRIERRYGAAFLVTVGIAAAGDPLTAAVLGFIAATIGNAAALGRQEVDSVLSVPLIDRTFLPGTEASDPFSARVGLLAFRGSFTVASARKLEELMENDIRGHETVVFDLSGMTHIDDSAAHLLQLLLRKAATMPKHIIVLGIPEALRGSLDAFDVLRDVPDARIVETMDDARSLAGSLLRASDSAPAAATAR